MFKEVLNKLAELPPTASDGSPMSYFYRNSIDQVIKWTSQLPNNPFGISINSTPKQSAFDISTKIEELLPIFKKLDPGIPDDLLIAGITAFIGTRPVFTPDPKPTLVELLHSPSQLIRSSVLLVLFARDDTNFSFNEDDLRWSIERRLLFAYPLELFGNILISLRKLVNHSRDILDLMLAVHSKGNPYHCGGSEFGAYKAYEMMLFFVEKGRGNREIIDRLMHLNEGMSLDPVEKVYVNRIRKLLAHKMLKASPLRDLIVNKIIEECHDGDIAQFETDGWMEMLMQVDPQKSEPGTLQILINIYKGAGLYYVSPMIKVIIHFARGNGNESREARKFIIEEINNRRFKRS